MIPFIGPLIGLISTGISSYTETKKIKLQNKVIIEQKKQDRLSSIIENESDWDKIAMEATKDSWKDEWFVVLFSIPAIMAFVPEWAPYVKEGFIILSGTPDWYKAAFLTAVAASFGLKQLTKFSMNR